jgi:hypothetical protein
MVFISEQALWNRESSEINRYAMESASDADAF